MNANKYRTSPVTAIKIKQAYTHNALKDAELHEHERIGDMMNICTERVDIIELRNIVITTVKSFSVNPLGRHASDGGLIIAQHA